jgi:hypothetical protein
MISVFQNAGDTKMRGSTVDPRQAVQLYVQGSASDTHLPPSKVKAKRYVQTVNTVLTSGGFM